MFQFKAHKELFPSLWIRYYQYALYKAGVPGYEKVRKVESRFLPLPGWYVHEDDAPFDVKNDRQNDMPSYSKTFEELPDELQKDPTDKELAPLHHNTLEEYTNEFISQMKLYQLSRPKMGDESSSATYVGRINQDKDDNDNDSDQDDTEEENNKSKIPQKLIGIRSCTVCNSKYPCYDVKTKICDECIAIYLDDYDKEDNENKELKSTTISNSNKYKQQYTYSSVLGSEILSRFDEATQHLMKITKDTRTTSTKDLNKARDSIIALLKDFTGDVEQAPKFYYNYCINVQKYNFLVSDCITILQAKLIGEASSWLTSKVLTFSTLSPDKVMPALLTAYRKQYMNDTHIETFRSELREIRLKDHSVTKQDLKVHYEAFVNKKNNLRICDPTVTEQTFKQMFIESLNSSILMYMGDSYKACQTVDDVFQLAEEGIKYLNKTQQYQPLQDPTIMNAMMYSAFNGTRDKLTPEQRSHSIDMENVTCFHCGKRGHFTYDCRIRKANVAQNAAGLKAWSTYCSKIGMVKNYDPKYYDTHPPKTPSYRTNDNGNDTKTKIAQKEKKKDRGRSHSPRRSSSVKDNNKGASNDNRNTAHIKAATAALKPHTTVDSEDEDKQ